MALQTAVVLFGRLISPESIASALAANFPVAERIAGPGEAYWQSGDGTLEVAASAQHSGRVEVQLFHRCWPDAMGDPDHDPELFAAWSRHQFGLLTFPYGLARAAAQPQAPSPEHVAFVMLSWSSASSESEKAPSDPGGRSVLSELSELSRVAAVVCGIPGALAWFSPNGEVLLEAAVARAKLQQQSAGQLVPELWISTRVVPAGNHLLVETLGMGALGDPPLTAYDHQVLLPDLGLDMDLVVRFLREISGAVRMSGSAEIPTETLLGPGGRWSPEPAVRDNPPHREVVRWVHDSTAVSDVSVVELPEDEAQRWAEHLHQHLGGEATVFHELLSDTIHLDVLVYAATDERPYHVLVTQGMSALPMTVPEGAEDQRFAELMLALPRDWEIDGDVADEERWYWPMRTLKLVARLPHLHQTWIGLGHTVPNGHPAEPYAEGTKLCCVIAAVPLSLAEGAWRCELSPGKVVRLYALVPLYEDEMQFKLEHGSEALFERLDERQVDECIDVDRRSVLAKRFWVV